jgi:hypothetical protein
MLREHLEAFSEGYDYLINIIKQAVDVTFTSGNLPLPG